MVMPTGRELTWLDPASDTGLARSVARRLLEDGYRLSGQGQGEAFKHACRLGLEGVVSKLAGSPYRSRRTDDWLKASHFAGAPILPITAEAPPWHCRSPDWRLLN
jgi:hypothetical protein